MTTHCIFLNCNNTYNICPYVKCVKMLLQKNCINNGITNGLKQKKEKSMQNSFIW